MLRYSIVLLSVVYLIGCSDSESSETQGEGVPLVLDASILGDMHTLAIDSAVAVSYTHLTLPTIYSV